MKKAFLLFCLFLSGTICAQDATLDSIFSEIKKLEQRPQDGLYKGSHVEKFGTINSQTIEKKGRQYQQFIQQLSDLSDETLSRQGYISKEVMLLKLKDKYSEIKHKMYLIPMTAEGGFYNSISFVIGRLPFERVEDYEAYLKWLPQYVRWQDEHLDLMKEGVDQGIVASKSTILNTIKLLKYWIPDSYEEHPLYKPFQKMPESWDQKVRQMLQQAGRMVITQKVIPQYRKMDAFLKKEYLQAAPEGSGIMYVSGGKDFYEDKVKFYTTLSISPDSVYALGLQEVNRIKAKMQKIKSEVGYEGSFESFLTFLRNDEQFYAKSPQELLSRAAWICKKSEEQLPKYFKYLSSLPFTVLPVPELIAPTYTAGRYVSGSWSQQRAGTYWVNTYDLKSRPLYTLPALSLHEAVPGHHLQISLVKEMTDISEFMKGYYISAFGEGWGLYSEYLGEEMGIYTTPYELFGRYTYEIWRACRLVIDVGIHYKGWTREEAIEYMKTNTALSMHEVTTEIDRYIGWPGQALSYKMGEIKIINLRRKAERALGDQFDIREFHHQILKNGSVSLPILEEEINAYISASLE